MHLQRYHVPSLSSSVRHVVSFKWEKAVNPAPLILSALTSFTYYHMNRRERQFMPHNSGEGS